MGVGVVGIAGNSTELYGIDGRKKPETSLDFQNIINAHIQEMADKVKKGDIQQKFMIGNEEFSLEEWEELLKKFDDMEKEIIAETEANAQETLEEWLYSEEKLNEY